MPRTAQHMPTDPGMPVRGHIFPHGSATHSRAGDWQPTAPWHCGIRTSSQSSPPCTPRSATFPRCGRDALPRPANGRQTACIRRTCGVVGVISCGYKCGVQVWRQAAQVGAYADARGASRGGAIAIAAKGNPAACAHSTPVRKQSKAFWPTLHSSDLGRTPQTPNESRQPVPNNYSAIEQ